MGHRIGNHQSLHPYTHNHQKRPCQPFSWTCVCGSQGCRQGNTSPGLQHFCWFYCRAINIGNAGAIPVGNDEYTVMYRRFWQYKYSNEYTNIYKIMDRNVKFHRYLITQSVNRHHILVLHMQISGYNIKYASYHEFGPYWSTKRLRNGDLRIGCFSQVCTRP